MPGFHSRRARGLLVFALLLLACGGGTDVRQDAGAAVSPPSSALAMGTAQPASARRPEVGPDVRAVLTAIRRTGRAPQGYRGGTEFFNDGRGGGQVLPRRDAAGHDVTYREWDLHPWQRGVNRGAERLVTGSDGSAWFTRDHYRTFIRIAP